MDIIKTILITLVIIFLCVMSILVGVKLNENNLVNVKNTDCKGPVPLDYDQEIYWKTCKMVKLNDVNKQEAINGE